MEPTTKPERTPALEVSAQDRLRIQLARLRVEKSAADVRWSKEAEQHQTLRTAVLTEQHQRHLQEAAQLAAELARTYELQEGERIDESGDIARVLAQPAPLRSVPSPAVEPSTSAPSAPA